MIINAHCSDLCNITFPDNSEYEGYVPYRIGIGGGDDIHLRIDVESGKILNWDQTVIDNILNFNGEKNER